MSEGKFVIALKTAPTSGPPSILPPMPWPWYGQLGDAASRRCMPTS